MKRMTLRVLICGAMAWMAMAQTFEAASVKPAAPTGRYAMRGGPGSSDPGQITYTKVTLKDLLTKAYGVEEYQIAGPPWLEKDHFDVIAKLPASATKAQLRAMLQDLLATRFHLAEHRETKELPIYALVVGKDGVKMTVSKTEPETGAEPAEVNSVSLAKDGLPVIPPGYKGHVIGMTVPGKTMLRAKGETLADFAKMLTTMLDRPVFDFTGLKEKYDFGIAWLTDQPVAREQEGPLDPGPDVFAAFQKQLGLRLEARKSMVEMVVVDQVDRTATDN
jgi:uncharacterized protein (TIGR03435 family)